MVIETRDRAKVGQTTFSASGSRWGDGEEIELAGCDGEYKTLAAAKLVALTWLKKGATQVYICRGTWEAQDIDDDEHGVVLHATWVQDEHWAVNGWADGNSGINWEEESW